MSQVYDYYPYGSEALNTQLGTVDSAHSFTDKELDEDLGLYYFEARWYSSDIGRFSSLDPAQLDNRVFKLLNDPQALNFYAYSRNNPVMFVDPDGEFIQYILAGIAGAGVGVGVQAGIDIYNGSLSTGQWSSQDDYTAAAVGGAAGGVTMAGTLNPYLAGAAGSGTQVVVDQYLETGSVDVSDVAVATVVGAALGAIPVPKIPGITSGKGSMSSIKNQISTKLENGTIKNVSLTTGGKIVTVDAIESAPGEIATQVAQAAIQDTNSSSGSSWFENVREVVQSDS